MSFLSKFNDLVFGPEDDDEVEFTSSAPSEPINFEPTPIRTTSKKSKVVSIATTTQMKVVVIPSSVSTKRKRLLTTFATRSPLL